MVCKKSKMTKKGFTLTEVIVVVAIIVILAGAGITGVIVSINDYNRYKEDLEENGGYHFEADAHDAVENMLKGAGSPIPDNTSFPDPTEITPTPTPSDPDPSDDETTTTTTVAQPDPTTTQNNGLPGSNVTNTNSWTNNGVTWHQPKISLPSSTNSITIYLPGNNPQFNTFGNAKVEPLGNNSFDFQVGGIGSGDVDNMYVVSIN